MASAATPTPGPWRAAVDMDGRHQGISILTENATFADEDAQPYHPLIAVVFHGRRKADRATAEATATLMAAAHDMRAALDPELIEAIADEIDCYAHSARAASLRSLAKRQRSALSRTEGAQ